MALGKLLTLSLLIAINMPLDINKLSLSG